MTQLKRENKSKDEDKNNNKIIYVIILSIILIIFILILLMLFELKNPAYTITFNGNGGTLRSGEAIQTIKTGGGVIAPVYTKEGYTLSWDKDFNKITG